MDSSLVSDYSRHCVCIPQDHQRHLHSYVAHVAIVLCVQLTLPTLSFFLRIIHSFYYSMGHGNVAITDHVILTPYCTQRPYTSKELQPCTSTVLYPIQYVHMQVHFWILIGAWPNFRSLSSAGPEVVHGGPAGGV